MQIIKKAALTAIVMVVTVSSVYAHILWVNSFESFAHKPGHVTIGLGWGHTLPIDDILNSVNGRVVVEEYTITDPNGKAVALKIPPNETAQALKETDSFDIFDGNIGLQKIALKKNSPKGVYKIEAKSKPTFYTQYIDKKDRKRLKLKSKDEVKDAKKVLMSVKYEALASSYMTLGRKWEEPKATNKGLEIIPKTDLSDVRVGDLVEFEVLFYGKPLHTDAKGINYITADSTSFGQSHRFSLYSKIKKGKAQFIVQSAGQWRVSCGYQEKVTKDGALKELYGKANSSFNSSTLTFNVK